MLNAQTAHLRFKKSQCPVHHIPDVKRADAFDIFFSLTRVRARETKKIKPPSVDRHPAVINRAQTIKFTLAVYFPAYPGIPLRQSGRRILRDPPSASARYLVTIALVTPPIIAGSSRRVNSASHAWSGQPR